MQNSFKAEIVPNGSIYAVEFSNRTKVIFRYETHDYAQAENLVSASNNLFLKWQALRAQQTANSQWATFAALCLASFYPTRTGGHAIIYTEIENAYL